MRVNRQASDPVLSSGFFVDLAHCVPVIDGIDKSLVENQGSVRLARVHQPKEEAAFEKVVKRQPRNDDVRDFKHHREAAVRHPVCQPFRVIILRQRKFSSYVLIIYTTKKAR